MLICAVSDLVVELESMLIVEYASRIPQLYYKLGTTDL